jgi:CheY-like chemotaxis protein
LIEDNEQQCAMYAEALRSGGFDVVAQGDLRGALELLKSGFVPHVCVCDMHLPNGEGLFVVRALNAIPGRWPFVLISGYYQADLGVEAFAIGPRVQQYVPKLRIALTEDAALERNMVTLNRLCRDAMGRYQALSRHVAMEVAGAISQAKPMTMRRRLTNTLMFKLATTVGAKWAVRGTSLFLIAAGGALTRYGTGNKGLLLESLGVGLTAMGGSVGWWAISKRTNPTREGE